MELSGTITDLLNSIILLFMNPKHHHDFQMDERCVDNLTGRKKAADLCGTKTL